MPSSSSVNPEHGAVTAAQHLAGNAGKETRATGAEVFASLLRTQEQVDALCEQYGVPKEFTARPAGDLPANSPPPPGAICVYARALEAGMRVPLRGFYRDVLAHFGIAPAQLTPNGWRFMAGFLVLCQSAGVRPSLAVFLRFFHLSIMDQKHEKGWYFFQSRPGSSSLGFTGLPNGSCKSIVRWRHYFFFLSSPEPWHCAVEWGEPSKSSFRNLRLTAEESKSAVKLLSAYGGAAVDLRNLLPARCSGRRRRLYNSTPAVSAAGAVITTASPPPPPPSTHCMMKVAAQASASKKKRTWEEANGREEPSRHDGQPLERASAANEPTDDAAIWQAASYVIELEEKLVARERDAAALREQLEGAKKELAAAKRAADAEREKAGSDLAAAGAELEKSKAELAAANRAVDAELVKTKAELAAARAEAAKTKAELAAAKRSAEAELVQAKAELTAAKRAAETELVKAKAKLAAAEAELESAKAAAVQQLLASEEHVRKRAEEALEGYKRWRGRQAPAGRAA
ncbi:uncharacterized protein LOC125524895 [Triticum urartu]|uniref:uncharacterized protein LOC125524895 n=1 Tax=Triticum urartu TaxID=4572 RepID=UPI002044051B|nr:uncharacterized protein LOC125524895 [Triticum urartu]